MYIIFDLGLIGVVILVLTVLGITTVGALGAWIAEIRNCFGDNIIGKCYKNFGFCKRIKTWIRKNIFVFIMRLCENIADDLFLMDIF